MFRSPQNLVFEFRKEQRVPLHMIFVFFPIDVVFLNKNMNIVEFKENFRPFTFFSPKKQASYVIELRSGIISSTNTKIGDKLELS